jgi:hypothetical protein
MTVSTSPQRISVPPPIPAPALRPKPAHEVPLRRHFLRGRERPKGITWFGIRSFWGHLQHLIASAIATEDIDSRDWMTADEPPALLERVSEILGAKHHGRTLTERLDRDVWIDYIADTGDDLAVSRAVAKLVFAPYEVPDPDRPGEFIVAPRGDVLLFGGDTAYPVATADEIQSRVVAPFNQVLAERDHGKRRALLGIPGNHDWYDGLDGFGRLFRRHVAFDAGGRPTLHGAHRTKVSRYAEWAVEFFRGGSVGKPRTMTLLGYTPSQGASYFLLPVAPGVPLLAVDRQLKSVDARQAFFFASYLNDNVASSPWILLPDPVFAFGLPSPTGHESLRALGISLTTRPQLILSGDIHHYRREHEGPTLMVTAGGGGAFLHPAPVANVGQRPAEVQWPSVAQSRALLFQVPLKVMLLRSGMLPHIVFAVLLFPLVLPHYAFKASSFLFAWATASLALSLIGGARRRPAAVVLATALAAIICASCVALRYVFVMTVPRVEIIRKFVFPEIQLAAAALVGALLFGTYLVLLTLFGYEHTQAFTALDHPGFKHFVRLRIRRDGSGIDGYCLGLVDPVRQSEGPLLVDVFTWKSQR